MIKLSIIIPYYNSAKSLKDLLLSIPNKKDIQIIVIDDKSDKYIDEYIILKESAEFNHVLFLNNELNKKGAGVCRNIGLKHAVGEWVLFADSDDYFIGGLYDKISCYFNSEYELVYFMPTSKEIDTGKVSDRHLGYEELINNYLEDGNINNEIRLKYRFVVPWSKLIKKELLTKNDIYFDEVMASNDVMFSSKVGYHVTEFKVDKSIIYCVTRGFGTLTTNKNEEIFDTRINVFIVYYKYLKERLNKSEFKSLQLFGLGLIYTAYRNGFGIKKMLNIYNKFRQNKVEIFNNKFLNPLYTFRKGRIYIQKHKNDKKYIVDK